ncbi:MAG: 30S ribosomal protein S8 [Chloroflexota bacterium]|nr:30S ribosomal protein S8 [Chloroflexota bacterium]
MTVTDSVGDMLTRIRNSLAMGYDDVIIPSSRLKEAIARVLQSEGYIYGYEVVRDGSYPVLRVHLKYTEDEEPVLRGLERVSKPGCRIYTKKKDIPWVKAGLGNVILSTPQGVMTGREARRVGVGGEILCKVW